MNVLLVNRQCIMGGIETWMMSLADSFKARGHECELFFFEHGPMEQYLPPSCTAHFGGLPDLIALVRSRRFDIVHAHNRDWIEGVFAVRQLGAKLVVTAHGWVVPQWTSAYCDALAGCSQWLVDEQKVSSDIPVHTVLNGIDTRVFRPRVPVRDASVTKPIVAWIGRGPAVDQKCLDRFAAIAPMLHEAGMRIWLCEPYGFEAVKEVLPEAAVTLRPLVEFWSGLPREEMTGFYQDVAASGGCIVSTSCYEGLPLSLLEAQACGCPVIGPNVRGVNECIDPAYSGFLYPFDIEPSALAEQIIASISDKALWQRWSDGGVRLINERFTLDGMAQRYLEIYRSAPDRPINRWHALKIRYRMSPLHSWKRYVRRRWPTGAKLYEATMRELRAGNWHTAAVIGTAAFQACPTLFIRPKRAKQLVSARVRGHLSNRLASARVT